VVLEEFYERQEGGLGLVLMMRSTVKDSSVVAVQIFDQKKFKRKVRTNRNAVKETGITPSAE